MGGVIREGFEGFRGWTCFRMMEFGPGIWGLWVWKSNRVFGANQKAERVSKV